MLAACKEGPKETVEVALSKKPWCLEPCPLLLLDGRIKELGRGALVGILAGDNTDGLESTVAAHVMLECGDLFDDLLALLNLGRLVGARVGESMVGAVDGVDDLSENGGPAVDG